MVQRGGGGGQATNNEAQRGDTLHDLNLADRQDGERSYHPVQACQASIHHRQGIPMKPVHEELKLNTNDPDILLEKGAIEFIDPMEQGCAKIALNLEAVRKLEASETEK